MRVEALGHGLVIDETLTREEMADEFLLMGLRLAEGIDPARYDAARRPPARPAARRVCASRARSRPPRTACCG